MDATHVHLILNHFPIIGTLIATVIMAVAIAYKNQSLQLTALSTWVLMALIAIPVFLTGEPAEETVEKLPGVVEATMEAHEEAAEFAFWLMEALGALSLVALILHFRNAAGIALPRVAFFVGIVVCIAMARTGYLGGQIRHTELSSTGAAAPNVQAGEKGGGEAGGSEKGEKDDD